MPRSPLARRLWELQAQGLSFGEMSRRATRAGLNLSSSNISLIANDRNARRLGQATIEALSVATGDSPESIRDLDDQRWGIRRTSTVSTRDAIAADPHLSDRDRRILLAQYEQLTRDEDPPQQDRSHVG